MAHRHGTYVGDKEYLRGKTALVYITPENRLMAQFDDILTGLGYSWTEFDLVDFVLDPDPFEEGR